MPWRLVVQKGRCCPFVELPDSLFSQLVAAASSEAASTIISGSNFGAVDTIELASASRLVDVQTASLPDGTVFKVRSVEDLFQLIKSPSGELFAAEEVARVADELPETVVCVDEAYFEYADETTAPPARERPNLVCVRTLSKAFGLAGLRVGYAVASRAVARELTGRRAPGPIANVAAALGAAALRAPEIAEREAAAARDERERLRAAFLRAGYDAPPTRANFVVVRTPEAPELAERLERRGLVVRAYPDALRIGVRSPADDDLVLRALGIKPPRASRRSATVIAPAARVSLVLDGTGRASSRTGDDDYDRRIEERASAAGWDLEAVADPGAARAELDRVLAEAEERAAG